jgi:hypothetical protein
MREKHETNVEPGEFPFEIQEEESRYLTWVRNHANYMAVRGLTDYLRAVSVLMRGIAINFLIFLPILLLASGLVAGRYLFMPRSFIFTQWALIGAVVVVLGFAFLTPHFRVLRQRRRLDTGSDSSVPSRDRFERAFGGILLLIVALGGFESLAYFLGDYHRLRIEGGLFQGTQLASITAVSVGVLAGADRLLKALGGIAQKLAVGAIGALGILVPVLIVLYAADFLVFAVPSEDWSDWTAVFFLVFLFAIFLALVLGIGLSLGERIRRLDTRSFTGIDFAKLAALMGMGIALLGPMIMLDEAAWDTKDEFAQKLHEALNAIDSAKEQKQLEAMARLVVDAAEEPGPELGLLLESLRVDAEYVMASPAPIRKPYDESDSASAAAQGVGTPPDPLLRELAGRSAAVGDLNHLVWVVSEELTALQRDKQSIAARFGELRIDPYVGFSETVQVYTSELVRNALRPSPLEPTTVLFDRPGPSQGDVHDAITQRVDVHPMQDLFDAKHILVEQKGARALAALEDLAAVRALLEIAPKDIKSLDRAVPEEIEYPDPGAPNYLNALFEYTRLMIAARGVGVRAAHGELAVRALYSRTAYPALFDTPDAEEAHVSGFVVKGLFLLLFAITLVALSWLTVDVNLTSIHGLYRDRLASAFLVGADTKGDVDVERDLDLAEICRHEASSTAPYHLINVALNLQGSNDMRVHDRKSDFFIFSKKFVGGERTNYCRSQSLEHVFPQMDLATAMAISAGAASPNMGRATSPVLTAIMVLLNIRLGYWMPNPGRLEHWLAKRGARGVQESGYTFDQVFAEEQIEIERRWQQHQDTDRRLATEPVDPTKPSPGHGLVGIGYSGGGIRSATINLGITQALHAHGVFQHIDYMSTVSGGGYLGSSISALMREKTSTVSKSDGEVSIEEARGKKIVTVSPKAKSTPPPDSEPPQAQEDRYEFENYADLAVAQGQRIKVGTRLLRPGPAPARGQDSVGAVFHWRVPPRALIREVLGQIDESRRWVNVSDGGHIENLACIELLRRRCKYIILGDAEADSSHFFGGLATLIRSARIDLSVHIEIDVEDLRIRSGRLTQDHFAVGRIDYPDEPSPGYLLYLKSSITGDEDEVIRQYRHTSESFPHESTADQFFGEGQFEAYRSLGQHMAESVLQRSPKWREGGSEMSYADMEEWFRALAPPKRVA